jgi:hypothetical protein
MHIILNVTLILLFTHKVNGPLNTVKLVSLHPRCQVFDTHPHLNTQKLNNFSNLLVESAITFKLFFTTTCCMYYVMHGSNLVRIMTQVLVVFLSPFKANSWIVRRLGRHCFLSKPFRFISRPTIRRFVVSIIRASLNNTYVYSYLLTYGAEPFLRSCQLCSHSGNYQQF